MKENSFINRIAAGWEPKPTFKKRKVKLFKDDWNWFFKDSDKDGVMNGIDCEPYNKKKQDAFLNVQSPSITKYMAPQFGSLQQYMRPVGSGMTPSMLTTQVKQSVDIDEQKRKLLSRPPILNTPPQQSIQPPKQYIMAQQQPIQKYISTPTQGPVINQFVKLTPNPIQQVSRQTLTGIEPKTEPMKSLTVQQQSNLKPGTDYLTLQSNPLQKYFKQPETTIPQMTHSNPKFITRENVINVLEKTKIPVFKQTNTGYAGMYDTTSINYWGGIPEGKIPVKQLNTIPDSQMNTVAHESGHAVADLFNAPTTKIGNKEYIVSAVISKNTPDLNNNLTSFTRPKITDFMKMGGALYVKTSNSDVWSKAPLYIDINQARVETKIPGSTITDKGYLIDKEGFKKDVNKYYTDTMPAFKKLYPDYNRLPLDHAQNEMFATYVAENLNKPREPGKYPTFDKIIKDIYKPSELPGNKYVPDLNQSIREYAARRDEQIATAALNQLNKERTDILKNSKEITSDEFQQKMFELGKKYNPNNTLQNTVISYAPEDFINRVWIDNNKFTVFNDKNTYLKAWDLGIMNVGNRTKDFVEQQRILEAFK